MRCGALARSLPGDLTGLGGLWEAPLAQVTPDTRGGGITRESTGLEVKGTGVRVQPGSSRPWPWLSPLIPAEPRTARLERGQWPRTEAVPEGEGSWMAAPGARAPEHRVPSKVTARSTSFPLLFQVQGCSIFDWLVLPSAFYFEWSQTWS